MAAQRGYKNERGVAASHSDVDFPVRLDGRSMNTEHTPEETAEAKRWGFNNVAAWKDAMKRSGMLQDMGYEVEEYSEEGN